MSAARGEPDAALQERIAAVLGWRPTAWRRVHGGYTPAARYRIARGGDSAFVKIATTKVTAQMLRRELRAYSAFESTFRPRFFGGADGEAHPFLVIEDLGAAIWPPPWTDASVADTLAAIAAMHATPARLPVLSQAHGDKFEGWPHVARDPAPFLSLGLATAGWLQAALPALLEAEGGCRLDGAMLAHFDLRSDNICFTARGPVFVDWAAACLGDADVDLGGWLPSLAFEGGPPPEAVLPDAPQVAALISGYFAARAGLPTIPDAPFVRRVQREQLSTALPWAIRALKLPPLEG